jgi:hypothetical protein
MRGSALPAFSAAMSRAMSSRSAGVSHLRVLHAVVEVAPHHQAQRHGRQALQQEEPLPAGPAVHAAHALQDPARDRAAQDARERNRREEQRGRLAAPRGRVPVGEVQDDAGEEARLGRAQQEADHVERHRRAHEHGGRREHAPGDHDAGDPAARAHAVQHHVAGHLEEKVADEEDARAQPVHRLAELQVALHLQLGEADVHAVEVGHDVAQEQQRDQPPADLAVDRVGGAVEAAPVGLRRGGGGGGAHGCVSLSVGLFSGSFSATDGRGPPPHRRSGFTRKIHMD